MSLKFMRDGVKSADVVTAYSINGLPAGNYDFFAEDLKNHIGFPKGVVLKALDDHFAKFSNYTQQVGLSNFANIDQDGNTIAKPIFPFVMRLHPHSSVQGLIPSEVQNGNYMGYIEQLSTLVPADSTIFDVYATDKPLPLGGVETLIGSIQLEGSFTSTKWGDQNMFFQHQTLFDDLALEPSWTPYYAQHSLGGKCPYQTML